MKKILVIEDQKSMALLLKQTIERHFKLDVLVAYSLQETRDYLAKHQDITLALSDLNLPDAPHGESISLLREAHITTVVLTASLDDSLRQRIMQERVADFIVKDGPAAINYLVRVLDLLLSNDQREIWLANLSDPLSRKLIGLLSIHRFKIRVFDQDSVLLKTLKRSFPSLLIVGDKNTEQRWFQQLSAVRSHFEFYQLPILACIEGEQGTSLALKYMKYGATDYIVAPFGADELYARVNQSIDLQRTYQEIQLLSQTDSLTGLHNRRYFIEQGEKHYQAWLKKGVFCLLVDIDFFKKINDQYGHPKGDDAIRFIATTIKQIFEGFVVARFGGEEFIVVGAYSSKQVIAELAERFRLGVEHASQEKVGVAMTVSSGLAFDAPRFDKLIAQADQQLYRAKSGGRNQLCQEDDEAR
ncbi:GGDEF domain-containing response regulator [Thiomicrospira microaerophila]|uniref:GGDEF domain-containing response regulator n=1 Tax=Thiomicrospira microaerophila TaxID=406020 RepID=UPI0005CB6AAA|nr:diguanylate cyclase [Thiomicrospira microaerophila]